VYGLRPQAGDCRGGRCLRHGRRPEFRPFGRLAARGAAL